MVSQIHHLFANYKRLSVGLGVLGLIYVGIALLPTIASAAVTVTSFQLQLQTNQVQLTWRTASEVNNAGFNILRSTSATGGYQKINPNLIPPKFAISGADYSYTDSNVTLSQTYYYKLQAVSTNGSTQEFGPQSTAPSNPTPTATKTSASTATKTNTPVPGSTNTPVPTITKTNTPAPTIAGATPTRTATPSIQSKSTNPPLPPTKVAVVVVPAQPTKPSASAPQVPSSPSVDNSTDSAPAITPPSESMQDDSTPEDQSISDDNVIDDASASPGWMSNLLMLGFFGVAGLLGLGGLALSAAAIYFLISPAKR